MAPSKLYGAMSALSTFSGSYRLNVVPLPPFHGGHSIPLGSDPPFALKNRPDVSLYPSPLHQPGKHKI